MLGLTLWLYSLVFLRLRLLMLLIDWLLVLLLVLLIIVVLHLVWLLLLWLIRILVFYRLFLWSSFCVSMAHFFCFYSYSFIIYTRYQVDRYFEVV